MTRPHYSIVTAHAIEPVTYAEAADHLRVDSDADESYITALIQVAREYCEGRTGRATTRATYRVVASNWFDLMGIRYRCCNPSSVALRLCRTPLASVTSVKYYAPDAITQTTISSTDYSAILTTEPGMIYFPGTMPIVEEDRPDAIEIVFVAGHVSVSQVPRTMRHIIKLMTAHLYENRTPVNISMGSATEVPITLSDLLQNQKIGGHFS